MRSTAVITGTSGQIGSALTQAFDQTGYHVINIDKQPPANTSATTNTYVVDITDNPQRLAEQIINEHGPIHTVVHNAAADDTRDFHTMTTDGLTHAWETNFLAPAIMSQTFAAHMIEHNTPGCLLFISTLHTSKIRRHVSYSTSKAATLMLATEMSDALASHNIRVNTITPGAIHDPEHPTTKSNTPGSTGKTIVPLGHLGKPHHITEAALFLCDNTRAAYITGANLTIDGGLQHYNWLHHTYGHNQPFQ